jgi:hypothetical protein
MAIYNEILTGRYARALQKLFSMKGPVPMKQLSGELMTVLPIFWGAEARYLEGWGLYGFFGSVAAVAANISGHNLRNPVGSNVIAVFTKISVYPAAGAAGRALVSVGVSAADLVTPISLANVALDSRGPVNAPSLIYTQQNTTPTIASLNNTLFVGNQNATVPQDAILQDDQEFPLLPGSALRVTGDTVNQTVQVALWWRERFLEESERT